MIPSTEYAKKRVGGWLLPVESEQLLVVFFNVQILFFGPLDFKCEAHPEFLGHKINSFMVASLGGLQKTWKRTLAADRVSASHQARDSLKFEKRSQFFVGGDDESNFIATMQAWAEHNGLSLDTALPKELPMAAEPQCAAV